MIPSTRRNGVSREDSRAVLFRRRTVNTYCRAYPRQVVEKHHFLTPETPVVDTMELPSHMLQDNTTSSYSRPISRSDALNTTNTTTQPVPSCNLDPVSMELTCSTRTEAGTAVKSITDKLNFLKQTLAHELSRVTHSHSLSATTTPTAPDDPQLLTKERGESGERDRDEEREGGERDRDEEREGGERDRDEEREGGKGEKEEEAENEKSLEPESVHLMSCENSHESPGKKSDPPLTAETISDNCGGGGEKGGLGGGSMSEIEVPRVADGDPASYLSPEAALQPLPISPDLPESLVSGGEREKYSVDLQGLCGLPPSDSATRPTDDGRKAKSATTNGRDRRKRSRNSSKSPKTRPESHQDRASSLTIKRKTKRRRRHTGNSPSITAEPGRERLREGEGELAVSVSPAPSVCSSHSLHQPARTKETSLEHHFNQLQITPILPPSQPHSLTKRRSPLTSTPVQQPSPTSKTNHGAYPLTSTPILSGHTHPLPDNLTDILESEMKGESNKCQNQKLSVLGRSSGVGSTMERLMDFEMMPYQASTVLDLSSLLSPATSRAKPASHHHCQRKTILSRAWKKGVKKAVPPPPKSENLTRKSGTTGRSKNGKSRASNDKRISLPSNADCQNQSGTSSERPNTKSRPEKTTTHQQVQNQSTTADKTSKKTARQKTTKRPRRHFIVPLALRPRPKKQTTKPHSLRKRLTFCTSGSLTPRDYPECILACHQFPAIPGNKVLSLTPHYTICRSPDSAISEDILTRPVAI